MHPASLIKSFITKGSLDQFILLNPKLLKESNIVAWLIFELLSKKLHELIKQNFANPSFI